MKKGIIISWIILALSLFAIVRDTNAISYNWSSTINFPTSTFSGWLLEQELFSTLNDSSYSTECATLTWFVLPQRFSMQSCSVTDWISRADYNRNYVINPSNYMASGTYLVDYFYWQDKSVQLEIRSYWGSGFQVQVSVVDSLWELVDRQTLIDASNRTSSWDAPDQYVVALWLLFYGSAGEDSFLRWLDANIYNDTSNSSWAIATIFSHVYEPAISMWTYVDRFASAGSISWLASVRIFHYRPIDTSMLLDSVWQNEKLNLLFSWTWESFYFSNWFGATWVYNPEDPGPPTPPTDYYADCEWFTDFWCYIAGFWNFILWTISDFLDFLFPDISFSGNFDSCGSFSGSWWTLPIGQRFWNIIAIINPFPPDDLQNICTLYWEKEIVYQSAIPDTNIFEQYIPGVAPELESVDLRFAFWQTPIDLIIIFGCMMVIFYHRSKHD